MLLYEGVTEDGDDPLVIERNISSPSSLFSGAVESGIPFVYVSRAAVFGLPGTYCESSTVNPREPAARAMAAMERNVLSYGRGYVIRISSSLDAYAGRVREIVGCIRLHPEADEYPVSSRAVSAAAHGIVKGLFGDARIIHLVGSRPLSLYAAANMVRPSYPEKFAPPATLLRSSHVSGLYAASLHAINEEDIAELFRQVFQPDMLNLDVLKQVQET